MSYNKIMNSDEYYGYEDRNYINPTMSRDEQLSFVDNLRKTQDRANTDIETQTHGLGMQIPSRKGGLNAFSTQLNTTGTGGPLLDENGVAKTNPDSFFNKRYQTPQLNSQVAALKSAAQASALNNILANEQAQYKKRYNEAYKAAKKRAAKANPSADPDYLTGDVETEAFDPLKNLNDPNTQYATSTGNNTVVVRDGQVITIDNATGKATVASGANGYEYKPYKYGQNNGAIGAVDNGFIWNNSYGSGGGGW